MGMMWRLLYTFKLMMSSVLFCMLTQFAALLLFVLLPFVSRGKPSLRRAS